MGHRPKVKTYTIKLLEENVTKNDLKFGRFLKCNPKSMNYNWIYKNSVNWTPVILKTFTVPKHYYENEKASHRLSKYFWNVYPKRFCI